MIWSDQQKGSLAEFAAKVHDEFGLAMVTYAETGRQFRTEWERRSRPDARLTSRAATRPGGAPLPRA